MKAVLALAVVAAAGLAVDQATGGRELRAVSAPAEAVPVGDGALLGAVEFDGPARLLRLRPLTLRAVSPPLRLREKFVSDFALSPDGRRLAIGSERHNRIEVVDLRRWRSLGTIRLPGPRPSGYGGAFGLAWPEPRRLVVGAGAPYLGATALVIDPLAGRVVHRSRWRGAPLQWEAHRDRLVVLAVPRRGPRPRPARLVGFDAGGRLRVMRLGRILAGSGDRGPGPARDLMPALAAAGERAYVVAADEALVAEVDLRAWRVVYHELGDPTTPWGWLHDLIEPPAHAKGEPVDAAWREAEVLPNGAIAVTGENWPPTDGRQRPPSVPFGLRLIDPATWTERTVDGESQAFTVAGGVVLARRWAIEEDPVSGIGVRAYDTAGERRFEAFPGADAIIRGAAGRHAYVEVKREGRRAIHVVDLASGRSVRTLPWREIRVLSP